MKFILAKKIGMTTVFSDEGIAQNGTLLEAGKNIITGLRTQEKNGYEAVQLARVKDSDIAKEIKIKPFNKKNFDLVCEFKAGEEAKNRKEGDVLTVEQFKAGEKVKIVGISKGKGFQGVMKRHNFSGSPATHGHKHDHRAPGSIGCSFPEHVVKGKRMAGRMGSERASARNIKVISVDKEKNQIVLQGAVPGNNGAVVRIIG